MKLEILTIIVLSAVGLSACGKTDFLGGGNQVAKESEKMEIETSMDTATNRNSGEATAETQTTTTTMAQTTTTTKNTEPSPQLPFNLLTVFHMRMENPSYDFFWVSLWQTRLHITSIDGLKWSGYTQVNTSTAPDKHPVSGSFELYGENEVIIRIDWVVPGSATAKDNMCLLNADGQAFGKCEERNGGWTYNFIGKIYQRPMVKNMQIDGYWDTGMDPSYACLQDKGCLDIGPVSDFDNPGNLLS